MSRRILSCIVLMLAGAPAPAQFVGRFSLPKHNYRAADRTDPVIVTFTLTNVSGNPLRIVADEKQPGCTGYGIEVTPLTWRRTTKPGGIVGSCPGPPTVVLLPGASRVEIVNATFLDYDNILDRPGRYRLRVNRVVFYSTPDKISSFPMASTPHQRFTRYFIVTMTAGKP